jgi:methylmalonyl-CoA mutase
MTRRITHLVGSFADVPLVDPDAPPSAPTTEEVQQFVEAGAAATGYTAD